MKKSDFEVRLKEVSRFLRKQKDVRISYLFGSFVKGKIKKTSDIDFAFYLDESLTKKQRLQKKLILISELSGILKTDRIDVVILNDTPLFLRYNVIKDGKVLDVKERDEKMRFEAKTILVYLDRQYFDDLRSHIVMERVERRG